MKVETNSGIVPENLLVNNQSPVRLVSVRSCDGIDFDRLLSFSAKILKLLRVESSEGKEPISLLFAKYNSFSPVRELIDGDIVPCIPLEDKLSAVTTALALQITPLHVIGPTERIKSPARMDI